MNGISVRITGSGFERVANLGKRTADLSGFMRDKAIPAVRSSVAAEFLEQSWLRPDGGQEPWRPLVPFGAKAGIGSSPGVKAGGERKLLIDSGAYYDAWTGRGSGGIADAGPRSAIVGVSREAFPFASYIRGGTSARIRTGPLLIFPQERVAGGGRPRGHGRSRGASYVRQWKLWWYLGLTFDVWLTEKTLRDGMKLYPRPHATNNPALTRKLARLLTSYIKEAA